MQIGFKIFLNITPTVTNWTADNRQFSLIFEENPLADFVELPDDGRAQDELWYSNILCGIIRGALEMVRVSLFIRANLALEFNVRELLRSGLPELVNLDRKACPPHKTPLCLCSNKSTCDAQHAAADIHIEGANAGRGSLC